MLSCASPAGLAAPQPHQQHQPWASLLHQNPPNVKSEPTDNVDDNSFAKDQTSGFYSEGFHSASPSSSSKDSNGHSPRSVGSAGEQSPFYDSLPLHAKANLGMQMEAYRNSMAYSLLTPPGFEPRTNEPRESSPGFDATFSPGRNATMPPHISTPLARADATPPKSPPRTPASPDRDDNERRNFHDSGYDVTHGMKDHDDGQDGSGMEDDYDEEPGLRVPAVNSHGKVKTFKCKQCNFVAVTKLSFWEHSKEHIKPEKMLTCPKCPFVTEYKHHLEYHMRNHFGSKPFQCTQCSYSCVNKSMLNSHLKSHSNIYQYRCADCNYATKYCHSLKLHLRKYKHNPAMVLNMDGTPNPFPIIDVYGTRRGPKVKSVNKGEPQIPLNNNNNQLPPTAPTHPLFRNHFPVNLPYLPPLLPHSFLFPPNNNYEQKAPQMSVESQPERHQSLTPPSILHQRLSFERLMESGQISPPAKSPQSQPRTPPAAPAISPPLAAPVNDALDLTSSKTSEPGTPPPVEKPTPLTPTTMKNRRKGRAYKLQPAALRLQHEEDLSGSESDASAEAPSTAVANTYTCQYCDITFGDLTMHTIHMGFHGYNDPFMCNKCGERSADKVAFFIHLGRKQHA